MTIRITVPGTLPSLNEMINASKRNKFAYEKLKDDAINTVSWAAVDQLRKMTERFPVPGDYVITWIRPDKRTDKDNVIAGQKFIFDAFQELRLLKNDGWSEIGDITHRFGVDKNNPRVEIEIREAKEVAS